MEAQFLPAIPKKITRMSKRRQKLAIPKWLYKEFSAIVPQGVRGVVIKNGSAQVMASVRFLQNVPLKTIKVQRP